MQSRFTGKNKLLTKNNTNMLSCSQDKPLMLRNIKSVRRWINYRTLNPFLFERILTKDYEDTAKNLAASNNYAI